MLFLSEQIELITHLNQLGIVIIQAEAVTNKSNIDFNYQSILNSTYNAAAALSFIYTIVKYTDMKVMTSLGINVFFASIPVSYCASSIGISSALHNYEKSIYKMVAYIKEIVHSISSTKNKKHVT